MGQGNDIVVLFLVIAGLVILLAAGLKNWVNRPLKQVIPGMENAEKPNENLVLFLDEFGYETICGKYKIPLDIEVDEQQLRSRIYIDALAKDDEEMIYAVKLAKSRQQISWTGSGVRDAFLPLLIAGNLRGVLYVDMDNEQVKKITFEWDENG